MGRKVSRNLHIENHIMMYNISTKKEEKKMTREEKAVVRAYIKMSYKKGWPRPTEYEMSTLIDNMHSDSRDYMALFIDREWENLMNKDKA